MWIIEFIVSPLNKFDIASSVSFFITLYSSPSFVFIDTFIAEEETEIKEYEAKLKTFAAVNFEKHPEIGNTCVSQRESDAMLPIPHVHRYIVKTAIVLTYILYYTIKR